MCSCLVNFIGRKADKDNRNMWWNNRKHVRNIIKIYSFHVFVKMWMLWIHSKKYFWDVHKRGMFSIHSSSQTSLHDVCNAGCQCSTEFYDPVCDENGTRYFSSCHAGCAEVSSDGEVLQLIQTEMHTNHYESIFLTSCQTMNSPFIFIEEL